MRLDLVMDIAPSRPPQSVREFAWSPDAPLPDVKAVEAVSRENTPKVMPTTGIPEAVRRSSSED